MLHSVRTLLLVLFCFPCFSQSSQYLFVDQRAPVTISGKQLLFPWTGGVNSPVVNEIDLNGDGIMDLMLFDRAGNRITTYLNTGVSGQTSYIYSPEYISKFPAMHDWVRTVDYDCDGDMDLVFYENGSMGVYRNDYSTSTGLSFTFITNQLISNYGSLITNIFSTPVNLPALVDVDGDGDLDILTFANSSNYIEYHENFSMDSLGTCAGFKFYLQPYCWGYFKLSGLSNIGILNQTCRTYRAMPDTETILQNRHSGSVLTAIDQDCDGDVDLINGDILGNNLLYLHNSGIPDSAYIDVQDSAFPAYNTPTVLPNLPAGYYLDVDNDGMKDLISAPFATVGEDYNNIYYYHNTTDNCSNVFNYIKNRFLAEDMIDVGTASNVVFFDVDQDGLVDIVAGNDLYYNVNPLVSVSRLAYFKNTGTATQPAYTLITDDWLGLSSFQQYGFTPCFGDIDGDGDYDLIVGDADGSLLYFKNIAGAGSPCNFVFMQPNYQNINIGHNSFPQLIDVDRDGKIDLLIGERNGTINYFQNTGTVTAPVFTFVTDTFGGINITKSNSVAGYSDPLLFDSAGTYRLLVGSESGYIYEYSNIDGNLAGTFTLVDSMYQGIYEPKRVTISMADYDGDGKQDLLTGNTSGGMRIYSQYTAVGLNEFANDQSLQFIIEPNPAKDDVNFKFMQPNQYGKRLIEVYDVLGNLMDRFVNNEVSFTYDISSFPEGLYVVKVTSNGHTMTNKLIKRN